jgi:hypothetical protein
MIKTNTLFILGAGASKPFGYPTGIELRNEILFGNTYENDIISALNRYDDNTDTFRKDIKNFRDAFSKSGGYSIDAFLEERPKDHPFMYIGKTFIAKILTSREKDNDLRINIEENWYMYLFKRMRVSFEELGQNNISFITFNYDRSLEYFLFDAIKEQFDKGADECITMMENFPIVHLYGQLDALPWQGPDGKEYSTVKGLNARLRAAPQNIQLINDERDVKSSEYFQKAYKLIEQAERIFFLGFSFDKTNLERLRLDRIEKRKEIVATTYKVEEAELKRIDRYFNQSAYTNNITREDMDAITLLKKHLEIE